MKKKIVQMVFVFSLSFVFSVSGSILCFAESEGYIDVKVDAPESFTHSILINLIDDAGVNYVVTAESANRWKSNYPLPEGKYSVDYVSFDVADSSYNMQYPDTLSIAENKGTLFLIKIEDRLSQTAEVYSEGVAEDGTFAAEKGSFSEAALDLLITIFLHNVITIIAIVIILIYLIKKRRQRNGEKY